MAETWTLPELVAAAAARIAALPAPKNGQVRAVPDERTVRYYGTLGLVDKPALQGRTAYYGPRHLAQVIAIKRLQSAGRSLAEIQALWPTLDDATLRRMSGVDLAAAPAKGRAPARKEFWKKEAVAPSRDAAPAAARASHAPIEVRIAIAPGVYVVVTPPAGGALSLSPADADAIRAAAAPLVTELARRRLTLHAEEEP